MNTPPSWSAYKHKETEEVVVSALHGGYNCSVAGSPACSSVDVRAEAAAVLLLLLLMRSSTRRRAAIGHVATSFPPLSSPRMQLFAFWLPQLLAS